MTTSLDYSIQDYKKEGNSQKADAQKALKHKCAVCLTMMPDPKTYKQHFESKVRVLVLHRRS